jgi:hypothetical protein
MQSLIVILSDNDYIEYALKSILSYKKLKIITRDDFGISFFDSHSLEEDALVILDVAAAKPENFKLAISIAEDKSADLQKPFHISTLIQLINHKLESLNDYIYPGNFSFFFSKRLLLNNQKQSLTLTEKEASLLRYLLKNPNKFISKQSILHEIWHYKSDLETTTLETHLYSLKSKFKQLCIFDIIEIQKDVIRIRLIS